MNPEILMQWRAEQALKDIGLETYGPNLIALSSSVLTALDDAGDVDAEHVEAIVDVHVGPQAICPDCIFAAVRESSELMCAESAVARHADSLIEALAMTLYAAIHTLAFMTWQRRRAAIEALGESSA